MGNWRFNFLDWEASRPGEGGGFTVNVVALLDEIGNAVSGATAKSGGDHKFWEDALHNLNTNLVDLPVLAGLQVSLPLLRNIVSSAAITLDQVNDPQWQKDSICARVLREADEATAKGDPEARADFEECHTYWTKDFPALADKTRSSILLGFNVLIRPFVTRPLRKIFSSDTNVKPEDAFDGKIIIVDCHPQSRQRTRPFAVCSLCSQQQSRTASNQTHCHVRAARHGQARASHHGDDAGRRLKR